MSITIGDDGWEKQLTIAFQKRNAFELTHLDSLDVPPDALFKTISDWCIEWDYHPKMISPTSILFRPYELAPNPLFGTCHIPTPGDSSKRDQAIVMSGYRKCSKCSLSKREKHPGDLQICDLTTWDLLAYEWDLPGMFPATDLIWEQV